MVLVCIALSAQESKATKGKEEKVMDTVAGAYVKLILKIGLHDADYVDAYYGPKDQIQDSSKTAFPLESLHREAEALLVQLETVKEPSDELLKLRFQYLHKQLSAARAKIEMLSGKKLTFDEESQALYDAIAPTHDKNYFENLLKELDHVLPGKGIISERLEKFKKAYIIPKAKLDTVFKAAITECRKRTSNYIKLPDHENFVVEYVTNKAWSAYNWYKGNSFSVIQVNTDLPIYIDRAIDLACHEGYPGHHVYNALLEKHMVNDRGWIEYSVYPLFSPQSLIAEGSANYGIEVAFPKDERVQFERDVLFPLAGMDPSGAASYYSVMALTSKLSYAGNEAARGYLNGKITKDQALDWLVTYGLYPKDRAEQRIKFIEKYRSYVINYNLGQDIVKNYIEKNGGTADQKDLRWKLFEKLLSTPQVPSNLN